MYGKWIQICGNKLEFDSRRTLRMIHPFRRMFVGCVKVEKIDVFFFVSSMNFSTCFLKNSFQPHTYSTLQHFYFIRSFRLKVILKICELRHL